MQPPPRKERGGRSSGSGGRNRHCLACSLQRGEPGKVHEGDRELSWWPPEAQDLAYSLFAPHTRVRQARSDTRTLKEDDGFARASPGPPRGVPLGTHALSPQRQVHPTAHPPVSPGLGILRPVSLVTGVSCSEPD